MSKLRLVPLAAVAALFVPVGVATAGAAGPVAHPPIGVVAPAAAPAPGQYQDGVVLVGFRAGVSASARHAVEARVGARELDSFSGGGRLLAVRPGRVPAVVAALRGMAGVRYAEPNYEMTAASVPNDPSFGVQWGMLNTGQKVNGTSGTAGADVKATKAWAVTTGSASVVIADVDSGVDYTHPDLAANIWSNPGGIGGCPAGTHGYNYVALSCDPMDDFYHGTHVAGIMGAVGNNGTGVAGINWTTSIMAVKWINSLGQGSTYHLIKALDWVVAAKQAGVNVRVVNDSGVYTGTTNSQALLDAINLLGANDILFVTAAGNVKRDLDTTPLYPCSFQAANEICVGASDQNDNLASFSDYGQAVNLAAPGVNIYSTLPGDAYGYHNGTSMSAPMVSGTAALVLSTGYQSVSQLKTDILGSVDPIPALAGKVATGGRLDTCNAVPGCSQSSSAPTVTSVAPNQLAPGATSSLNLTGTGFTTGATVGFGAGSGVSATGPATVGNATSMSVPVSVSTTAPNGVVSVTVTASGGSATCQCLAVSNGSTSSPAVTGAAPVLLPRTVTTTVTLSGSDLEPGATVSTSAGGSINAGTVTVAADGSSLSVPLTASSAASIGSVDVTVQNPDGGNVTCPACVSVIDVPSAPTITSFTGGSGQVTVTWSPPTNDNGSAVTSYTVISTRFPKSPFTVAGNVTTFTVTGLPHGVWSRVEVFATNSAGTSASSGWSNSVKTS